MNRIIVNNDYIVLFLVCVGGYLVVVELFLVYGVDFIYCLKDGLIMLIEVVKGGYISVVCYFLDYFNNLFLVFLLDVI